jgi:hypothetical protein
MLTWSVIMSGSGHVVAYNLVDDSKWGPVSLNLETCQNPSLWIYRRRDIHHSSKGVVWRKLRTQRRTHSNGRALKDDLDR